MRKIVRWAAALLLISLISCAGLLLFLAYTETGLHWVYGLLAERVPGTLSVRALHGRLAGPVSISGLRYSTDKFTIAMDKAQLDWMPYFLSSGEVVVTKLSAGGISIVSTGKEKAPRAPFRLPEIRLPLTIVVRDAQLRNIEVVRQGGAPPLAVQEIAFEANTGWGGTVYFPRLAVQANAFSIRLKGKVRPLGDYPFSLHADWAVRPEAYPAVRGSGGISGTLKLLKIRQELREPFRAAAAADISDIFGQVTWKADLHVARLVPHEINRKWPSARITGDFRGSGDLDSLTIGKFSADILDGRLTGSGSVRWKPEIAWKFSLSGSELNPGALWPEWPGRLAVQAETAGRIEQKTVRGSVDLRRISGVLRGYPFRAALRLLADRDAYTLSGLDVSSGSAHLAASGRLLNPWDLRWEVSAPRLENLVPGGRGSLSGSGRVTGPRTAPFIAASVKGVRIAYKEYQADSLILSAGLDMQDRKDSRIGISAAGLRADGRNAEAVSLRGTGRASGHVLTVMIRSGGEVFDADVSGAYKEKIWQGVLRRSGFASRDLGRWILERPGSFAVNFAKKYVDAGRWCWVNAASRLCLLGSWRGEAGSAGSILAEQIPLALFRPFLPAGANASGVLNGKADVKYAGKEVYGTISLKASPGSASYSLDGSGQAELAYREILFNATMRNNTLAVRLDAPLTDGGVLRGALTITGFPLSRVPKEKQQIQGSLSAEIYRLGIIQALVPSVRDVKGVFRADITLGGTVAQPSFAGTAELEDGAAEVPRLGITVREARLSVSGRSGSDITTIQGELKSGPGTIALQGQARLNPQEGWPLSIRLKGENFEAARIPAVRLYLSPDIDIRVKGRRIDVTGEVAAPRAVFVPRDLSQAVRVSEDVVIVDRAKEEERKGHWMIYSRVKIILGNEVFFNGYGLSGRIKGDITAVEEPQQVTVGTGELQIVEGKYTVYGQSLDIERGRLLFAGGPVDNPALDVRVIREVEDTTGGATVGINVQGNIKKPRMTLFSIPAMDQTEALSYLVLGKPMQSATGEQGQALYNAARSLSLTGGEFIARRIGSVFGIRDIRIERGTKFEEASLVLGTYLSPRLYVGYGIGLFAPSSTFRLRYGISKKFQAQVESGTQSGADIFYKFER